MLLVDPEKRRPSINLSLGYIGEFLKYNGIDANFLNRFSLKRDEKLRKMIKRISPDIVGISSVTANFNSAIEVADICKDVNDDIKVVFGGYHPTALPVETLKNKSVDFVVIGEGEHTMLELVREIEKDGKNFEKICGISFKKGKNIKITKNRSLIQNIDSIPMPHPFLPIGRYSNMSFYPLIKLKHGTIMTSRGCPMSCKFCSIKLIFKNQYRTHSIDRVMEEIKYLNDKGINIISFSDSIFTCNKKRVKDICKNIIKEKFDIKWSCFGHINFVDKEVLYWMKKAGCIFIKYGIESGNQSILNSMNKNININKIKEAISLTKKIDITTSLNFIIGFPSETLETAMQTINLAKDLNCISFFRSLTPYPGTEIYDWAKKNNLLLENNFEKFTPENVVMTNGKLNESEIKSLIRVGYKKIFLTPKALVMLRNVKNPYRFFYYMSTIKDFISQL